MKNRKQILMLCLLWTMGMTVQDTEAQVPDASKWLNGQDVSAYLDWGDYSGVWSPGSYQASEFNVVNTPYPSSWWKGSQPNECALGGDFTTYPVLGFYNDGLVGDDLINMYQVIQLPAGVYTFKFNAVYREGTPAKTWENYVAKTPRKNAHGYVTVLASDDPDGAVIRDFDRVIVSLPYSNVHESLFTAPDAGTAWMADGCYTIGNSGSPNDMAFYPNCIESAALHFMVGNYAHELKFILLNDGYVRIGLRKTANISQDWIAWSNMRIIYEGPADENGQLEIASADYNEALEKIKLLESRVYDDGFTALLYHMEDYLLELDPDLGDINAVLQAKENLETAYDNYLRTYTSAKELVDLIASSEDICASTNFQSKSSFSSVLEYAKEAAYMEFFPESKGLETYAGIYRTLSAARLSYLNSQEVGPSGEKDFTSLIKHPWFVNSENTPILIDNRRGDGAKVWAITVDGEAVSAWDEQVVASGATGVSNVIKPDAGREDIVSKVTLSDDVDVTNQWFKYVNWQGWSPGLNLMYHGGLIGPSDGWNSITGGTSEIRQQLVGLPEGYYSLKGLMRGNAAGGTWDKKTHNIFAQNSNGDIVKSPVGDSDANVNSGWTVWGWNEWNGRSWAEHETSTIAVPDGKLLIGAQTSMVMITTGFRLYYYGTNSQFDTMIQEYIQDIEDQFATKNLWPGDKAFVQGKLTAISGLRPLNSIATFDQAVAYAQEATDYMRVADGVVAGFTAIDDYNSLLFKYGENSDQYLMLQPALNFVTALPGGETSTYLDAEAAGRVFSAYASYMEMYDKGAGLGSGVYAPVLAKHAADLKANYKDVEALQAYEAELALIYSQVKVTKITLSSSSLALEVGETSTLRTTVSPSNATNKSVIWSSSDRSVATVSSDGVVLAVSPGIAIIKATANDGSGVSASCKVTVTALSVDDTDISKYSNAIYTKNISVNVGSAATLSINMKNSYPTTAYSFQLYAPQEVNLSAATVTRNKTRKGDDVSLSKAVQPDGSLKFICYTTDNEPFSGNDGEIFTATFNIPKDMEPGDYPILIKDIELSESGTAHKISDVIKSTMTVMSYIVGDANSDGEVSVSDLSAIVGYLLQTHVVSTFNPNAADANVDGDISVSDLSTIVRMILGMSDIKTRGATGHQPTYEISADDIMIAPGEDARLMIDMKNPNGLSGFQFDMKLPEGLACTDIHPVSSRIGDGFFFADAEIGEGLYRTLCYSLSNAEIIGNGGSLVEFTIHADSNLPSGTYGIEIDGFEVSDGTKISPFGIGVNVAKPTDIQRLPEESDGVEAINYNLSGQQVDRRFKGIVIRNGEKHLNK